MSEVTLTLPDTLVEEANANGLLTSDSMAAMLKKELRRRATVDRLFAAADRLAELGEPMSDDEGMAEVRAVRDKSRQSLVAANFRL